MAITIKNSVLEKKLAQLGARQKPFPCTKTRMLETLAIEHTANIRNPECWRRKTCAQCGCAINDTEHANNSGAAGSTAGNTGRRMTA